MDHWLHTEGRDRPRGNRGVFFAQQQPDAEGSAEAGKCGRQDSGCEWAAHQALGQDFLSVFLTWDELFNEVAEVMKKVAQY